ncbi:MAG: hypothetical protein M1818_001826 [Claussenomyces sp. TS43310]|nr:MAG: hypothetical protein M1818_001826 [Claussenomyces sp. TS43310]
MAAPVLSARLKYLNESAHLLAMTSRNTSAYLMSQCNSLLFDSELEQPASHQRRVCGACGNIMILGHTATMVLQPAGARGPTRVQKQRKAEIKNKDCTRSIIYRCAACARETRQSIDTPKPRAVRPRKNAALALGSHAALAKSELDPRGQIESPGPSSANANSKKRAKSRKQGGLQALLAKNREAAARRPSRGFGLDLMDLMKKG